MMPAFLKFSVMKRISCILETVISVVLCANPVAGSPPNIIFIMADDLGYGDLGSYGQKEIMTPNTDQLAREGIRFTQAYAGGPVCTPSRSVLMTGQHNGNTPAKDNIPHFKTYLHDGDVTLAEVLKAAGYGCGGIGKWSLGDPGTEGSATRQGFDMWFGYMNQDHAHYYYPEYLDDNEERLGLPGNATSRNHYSHDLMTDRALEFIKDSGGDPFFLYAAYTLPHFSSPDEDPTQLPIPSDAPYTDRDWSQQSRNYAAMVTRLDRDVGRIVDLIDELGLSDQTLIIFTSDNGPWSPGAADVFDSNGPFRGAKRDLYEGGIRVPFIARWPGRIPKGFVSPEIITFWDMLPTLAAVAGASIPEDIDGISVLDAFFGHPVQSPHAYLYWDYGHTREHYLQAVRLDDWKAIRRDRGNSFELYNLRRDPGETLNVAESYPGIARDIKEIMDEAAVPDPDYPVGNVYTGSPVWTREQHW
jgi:arylsulfatase A-like enzyme